jgi:hypothetical protein
VSLSAVVYELIPIFCMRGKSCSNYAENIRRQRVQYNNVYIIFFPGLLGSRDLCTYAFDNELYVEKASIFS